jgi:hypothetical protein
LTIHQLSLDLSIEDGKEMIEVVYVKKGFLNMRYLRTDP